MKHIVIQIVLGIILTVATWFFTFLIIFSSGDDTVASGETYAIPIAGLLHLLWLIPYVIFFSKRKNSIGVRSSVLVFAIFWVPWVVKKFHTPEFDSEEWKTGLSSTHFHGELPAHSSGYMVPDIVESKILIGKNQEQIEELLGKHSLTRKVKKEDYNYTEERDGNTEISYYYNNGNAFDLCDELLIILKDGACIEVFMSDCD